VPFCAISDSVLVRSIMVSLPSSAESRSTVRCWRSVDVSFESEDTGRVSGVSGGE
jgi:hypothetical protein